MKKGIAVLMLSIAILPLAGCGDPCKEDVLSKLGDTLATIGKQGVDKDKILLERTAERAGKCAEKEGGKLKKNLGF